MPSSVPREDVSTLNSTNFEIFLHNQIKCGEKLACQSRHSYLGQTKKRAKIQHQLLSLRWSKLLLMLIISAHGNMNQQHVKKDNRQNIKYHPKFDDHVSVLHVCSLSANKNKF